MARVDGLYGHIQRNDRKSVILIATFVSLFLITQFSFRLVYFWPIAQAEANGTLQPLTDDAPLFHRLFGADWPVSANGQSGFKSGRAGDMPQEGADGVGQPDPAPGIEIAREERKATVLSAIRLMFERSQYLALQCLALIAFAIYYVYASARRTGLLIRYATRARPLERKEYPALYNLVENLAITAGLPCPSIELIESPKLNAYATGFTPASARLGLTTGLIEKLDRHELAAVVAHEITHIRNRDTRLMAINKACADLVLETTMRIVRAFRIHPSAAIFPGIMLLVCCAAQPALLYLMFAIPAMTTLAVLVCKSMMHHSREFIADAGAIELTKNPAALVSALSKMAGTDAALSNNMAVQAMMFAGREDGGWLSTHPTLAARVQAIAAHGGLRPGETHVIPRGMQAARASLPAARPVGSQTTAFGRRQPRTLAPRLGESAAARSFVLRSTAASVLDDRLPPPPVRGDRSAAGAPQPTLLEQITMEGAENYFTKRPLLYIPLIICAVLLLPVMQKVMLYFGFQ